MSTSSCDAEVGAENLSDILLRRAQESPESTALVFETGGSWSFRDLACLSGDAARLLSERLERSGEGSCTKRSALVFLQNSPRMVCALLGLWRARITAIPLNVMYKPDEIRHSVSMTQPQLAVTTADRVDDLRTAGFSGAVVLIDEFDDDADERSDTFQAPSGFDDVDAIVLFTGGSTGLPKAVTVTHEGFNTSIRALASASKGRSGPYDLAPEGTPPNLLYFPLFHSGGINALLFAWTVGRTALLMERFRAERVVRLVRENQIDNLFLLPTMMFDLVQLDGAEESLASVKTVLASGQELSGTLRKRFEEKFRVPIQSNYGSTEVGHVAGWTTRDIKAGRWVPGAVGQIYDDVEVEIRDDEGRPVPAGTIGELWVRTEVTRGYMGSSAERGEEGSLVRDGWVRTRDVGYLDEERRLFLSGRARDMIKCGGFQVWPSEIEEAMLRSPLVRDVAVVAQKDDRLVELPVAFVVPATPDDGTIVDRLTLHCRAELAGYKQPRKIVLTDAIPRNEAGKTDKVSLSRRLTTSGSGGPATRVEEETGGS